MVHPQAGGLLELVRQLLQHLVPLQPPDGLQLGLGGLHHLVQVGGVAVHPPVHAPPQILLQLGVHHLHGGQGGAHGGEKVLDGLALLEVDDRIALPPGVLGGEVLLPHKGQHLPADAVVGGGQLQVVPLSRVGHRPPGQKGPPQEGGPAAVLLQHGEVDVQGQGRPVRAVGLMDGLQLAGVLDGEDVLSLPLGQAVEGEPEGFFEQDGQPLGKGLVLGDDAHLVPAEGVAVEQHPVGLRLGAALLVHLQAAQLVFYLSSKGHALTPL